jgi:hypothetical protein
VLRVAERDLSRLDLHRKLVVVDQLRLLSRESLRGRARVDVPSA